MYRQHTMSKGSGERSLQGGSDAITSTSATAIGNAVEKSCGQLQKHLKLSEELTVSLAGVGRNIKQSKLGDSMFGSVKEAYSKMAEIQAALDKGSTELTQLKFIMKQKSDNLVGSRYQSSLMKAEVVFEQDINVESEGGARIVHVYGIHAADDGRVVLTDYWNRSVKMLNAYKKVVAVTELNGNPWGLCQIDENKFGVSLTDTQGICVIEVKRELNKITVTKTIPAHGPCRGLTFLDGCFWVVCGGFGCKEESARLLQISTDGTVLNSYGAQGSEASFMRPRQIISTEGKIYITDADDIKVLDVGTKHLTSFKVDNIKSPFGICSVSGGMLVSCFRSGKLVFVQGQGKDTRTVLERGQHPLQVGMAYNKANGKLIFGMERCNSISVHSITFTPQ